jgi:hypothetical protein
LIAVIVKLSFELKKVRFQFSLLAERPILLVHISSTAVLAGSVRQVLKFIHVNCGEGFNPERNMLQIFEM